MTGLRVYSKVTGYSKFVDDVDEEAEITSDKNLPSGGLGIFLIFLPIFIILLGTIASMICEEGTMAYTVFAFLGDKNIALLIGVLVAFFALRKYIKESFNEVVTDATTQSGAILAITGAGGAFGAIINATGIGDQLVAGMTGLTEGAGVAMIIAAIVGVFISNPQISTPLYTGFTSESGSYLFPTLFVTIACGAVSGFHSLVSSETSSKQISNEKDMLQVGYGSMLLESLLAVLVIVVVGSLASLSASGVLDSSLSAMAMAEGATPFTKFSVGVTGLIAQLGLPQEWGLCIMTMFVSALALTSLDAVARIGRMSFQEFFENNNETEKNGIISFLTNKYVATVITLLGGYLLSLGGYNNIWPLFGSANQLLAAMVLIVLSVFLKVTGRKGFMLYAPMIAMLVITMTSLGISIYNICMKLFVSGGFVFMTDGLQLIVAILLVALGLLITFSSGKKLVKA